jgi:putative chitobiose transport system substrate-binding protein
MKFQVKYTIPLLIVLNFLLLLTFIGCNTNQIKQQKNTLEFWTISLKPTYTDYLNSLIKKFEASHPSLKLEWIDVPINVVSQKFMASLAGGEPPDLVNLNSDYALALAQNNALINMDKALPAKVKAAFFPGIWQAARYQGANYAVPWYVSTPVILYNKEIFLKAGLDPHRPPRTWTVVEEIARTIKARTGIYGYMPSVSAKDPVKFLDDLQCLGIPILAPSSMLKAPSNISCSGGAQAVFATPEAAARLDWYVNLYRQDLVPKETVTQGYQGALDRYQAGALGILIAGPQFILRIAKNAPEVYKQTAVAPYPLSPNKIVPAAVMNWVIPKGSRQQKNALALLEFITNKENQLEFCKLVPLLPSRKDAAQDPYFTENKELSLEAQAVRISIYQLPYACSLSLGLPNSPRLYRAIKEAIEKAYYGRATSLQALQEAQKQWNAILKE